MSKLSKIESKMSQMAAKMISKLKPNAVNYSAKVKLLVTLMHEPNTGHILPKKLYGWASKKKQFKISNNSTDGCIWDSISMKK
jgi:hypothetical protein